MDNTSYPSSPHSHLPPPPDYSPLPRNPDTGKALVIAAVVTGALSVLLCWVPFVNNLVFLSAPVGIGLAIPALVGSGKTTSGAKGLPITGLVLSVFSLIGTLGTQLLYSSWVLDDVVASVAARSGGVVDGFSSEGLSAATEALALGSSARVGEYSVTVTAVDTNATDVILAMSPYNEPPQGQYVLVDVGVIYHGNGEGDPWRDLNTKYIGADARQYDARTCSARTAQEVYDLPTLESGGAGEFHVCMDVPVEALADAEIFVEESPFLGKDRAYWSIP